MKEKVEEAKVKIPRLNIPMMSDERWKKLAKEQAVKNFIREHGYEPESVQQACAWQREWLEQKMREELCSM